MPRQLRVEFDGATYHVMARVNRREKIYLDDVDRQRFLKCLETACGMCGWRMLAWVLMSNHYHLVIHTPQGNLVEGMRWLQNAHTRYFNTKHWQWGRLFVDRFKSVLVDDLEHDSGVQTYGSGGTVSYHASLVDYVHLNPARAKLVKPSDGESIRDYQWSSVARGYALAPSKRPAWLDVEWGLSLFDLPDTVAGRRRYVEALDKRVLDEGARKAGLAEFEGQSLQSTLCRGWYWGGEAFKEKILAMLDKLQGGKKMAANKVNANTNFHSSPLALDHAEAKAQSILEEGLAALDMKVDEEGRPQVIRGDYRRAALAWAIWRKTSVSQNWIAERLALRSPGNVSQQIRRLELIQDRDLPPSVRKWMRKMDKA